MNDAHALCRSLTLGLLAALWLALGATSAAAQTTSGVDEQALIERLKAEIIKELRDSGALREAVSAEIEDMRKKQLEARAKARADSERRASAKAKNVRRVSAERDHIYGNLDAPVSIIEYSDFECPYCKRFHATPKQLVEQYAGKVNWVYRHFPLGFHNPGAQKQAEASECAAELGGNEAFWKYADALYERTESGGKGFPLAKLVPLAEELGLDGATFKTCLDSGKFAARVKEDFAEGGQAGITGTPGNILLHNETGEARLKSGAQPARAFEADIDRMLATSKE